MKALSVIAALTSLSPMVRDVNPTYTTVLQNGAMKYNGSNVIASSIGDITISCTVSNPNGFNYESMFNGASSISLQDCLDKKYIEYFTFNFNFGCWIKPDGADSFLFNYPYCQYNFSAENPSQPITYTSQYNDDTSYSMVDAIVSFAPYDLSSFSDGTNKLYELAPNVELSNGTWSTGNTFYKNFYFVDDGTEWHITKSDSVKAVQLFKDVNFDIPSYNNLAYTMPGNNFTITF